MAVPPNPFLFLFFYERYKCKFYENKNPLSTQKPLPFILWFLRFLGKLFLVICIVGVIGGLSSVISGNA